MNCKKARRQKAPPDTVNAEEVVLHPICWRSTVIPRVCKSTLMAETFSLGDAVDRGSRIRAPIVDMKGKLIPTDWENSASQNMGHLWLTDCDSLYEHLSSPRTNSEQTTCH